MPYFSKRSPYKKKIACIVMTLIKQWYQFLLLIYSRFTIKIEKGNSSLLFTELKIIQINGINKLFSIKKLLQIIKFDYFARVNKLL